MSNFLSKKRVNFPRVILDVLLGSMELAIEMVIKITDDFKIVSEVKSLRIARLGYINVRFLISSTGDECQHNNYISGINFQKTNPVASIDIFSYHKLGLGFPELIFDKEPKARFYFQVGVIGLSKKFGRVVDQLVKIGVRYLRRHLEIVIEPLKQMMNGFLVQFAPNDLDDLTAFLF